MRKLIAALGLVLFGASPALADAFSDQYTAMVGRIPLLTSPFQSSDRLSVVRNGIPYKIALPLVGPLQGPTGSTVDEFVLWDNAFGTALKDGAGVRPIHTGNLTINGTLSGTQPQDFVDVLTVNADTTTATHLTDPTKISAIGAYNTFGNVGGPNAAEGSRTGLFSKIEQVGPTDYTSVRFSFITSVFPYLTVPQGNSTVGQELNYTGVGALTEVGGTTRVFNLTGGEFDVAASTNTVVGNRIGVAAVAGAGTIANNNQGQFFDAGFTVETDGGTTWRLGYSFAGPNGVWPYNGTTSELMGVMPGTLHGDVGTGIDMRAVDTFGFAQIWTNTFMVDPGGRIVETTIFPAITLRDTNVAVNAGGLTRWLSTGAGWLEQINTAVAGDFSATIDAMGMSNTGDFIFAASLSAASFKVGGVAGANCTIVGATAHLTVVNGLVTLCN